MTSSERPESNILRFDRPDTVSIPVQGETRANIVASELICGGVPFHVQPMADESYVFTVTSSCGDFLKAVTAVGPQFT